MIACRLGGSKEGRLGGGSAGSSLRRPNKLDRLAGGFGASATGGGRVD